MIKSIRNFRKNNKGATAIEYSLIAALVSIAAITGFQAVGNGVQNTMSSVATAMKPAGS